MFYKSVYYVQKTLLIIIPINNISYFMLFCIITKEPRPHKPKKRLVYLIVCFLAKTAFLPLLQLFNRNIAEILKIVLFCILTPLLNVLIIFI